MSEENSGVNILIHDANGNPRVVKVVKKFNPAVQQIKVKQSPLKIIRITPNENKTQVPVLQPLKLPGVKCSTKLIPVPVQVHTDLETIIPTAEPINTEFFEETVINSTHDREETSGAILKIAQSSETKVSSEDTAVNKRKITNMSNSSKRRYDSDNDVTTEYTTKRRRHADKVGKGLRHFSMKVCEKVRNKGFTSYNEVADELVLEFASGMHGSADSQKYDDKNIRRRVYDALNVLMAMNIISKKKKEIRWLGLPKNSVQEFTTLEKEKQEKIERIEKKTQQLHELILQHISFKSLIERNKEAERRGVKPSTSSAIHLPFIVVNTSDKALIDCSISNDKTEYMFNFNKRFQIHDDIDILKRMGLLFGLDKGECTEDEIEKAKKMVPKSLEYYVEQMGRGTTSKLSSIIEEEGVEGEEEGLSEGDEEVAVDEESGALEYSEEDSSDVDV